MQYVSDKDKKIAEWAASQNASLKVNNIRCASRFLAVKKVLHRKQSVTQAQLNKYWSWANEVR